LIEAIDKILTCCLKLRCQRPLLAVQLSLKLMAPYLIDVLLMPWVSERDVKQLRLVANIKHN
jgi:hypothetical protein